MKTLKLLELKKYLDLNYSKLYDDFQNFAFPDSIDGVCDACNKDVFFKVKSKTHSNYAQYTYDEDNHDFYTLWVTCPRCNRDSFIQYIKLQIERVVNNKAEVMPIDFDVDTADDEEEFSTKSQFLIYELMRIPTQENTHSLAYIPETHESLKLTVSEALFCMEREKQISAVIMFRRALQIIAKEILGAKGKTLYSQLEWLKTNENNLKIDLNEIFHENTTIIKDVGNQGAHPEEDDDLKHFTKRDVQMLHDLFLIIVTEIFIKPEKIRKIKEELKQNRKLT
ncbi:MAG: DUF4145 domain-containing protein [Pedobacter sp.]|nr:MAG: DUF4145 domain-containing protein [Pedobacter sp.]